MVWLARGGLSGGRVSGFRLLGRSPRGGAIYYCVFRMGLGCACLGLFFAEASRVLAFPQLFSSAAIIASDAVSTRAGDIDVRAASYDRGREEAASKPLEGGVNEASPKALLYSFPSDDSSTRAAARKNGLPNSHYTHTRGRGVAGRFPIYSLLPSNLHTSKRGSGRRTPAATPAAASPITGEKPQGSPAQRSAQSKSPSRASDARRRAKKEEDNLGLPRPPGRK